MNYYEILEISKNASGEVIKNAYRALAKKYHPDSYKGDKKECEEKIRNINKAYEVLSDPQKREEYDLGLFEKEEMEKQKLQNNMTKEKNKEKLKKQKRKIYIIISIIAITVFIVSTLVTFFIVSLVGNDDKENLNEQDKNLQQIENTQEKEHVNQEIDGDKDTVTKVEEKSYFENEEIKQDDTNIVEDLSNTLENINDNDEIKSVQVETEDNILDEKIENNKNDKIVTIY